jgi:hypothetical protein
LHRANIRLFSENTDAAAISASILKRNLGFGPRLDLAAKSAAGLEICKKSL